MRTTLTLDDDLAEKLQELAAKRKTSFKQVVNDVLRKGMTAQSKGERPPKPFHVVPFRSAFRGGRRPSEAEPAVRRDRGGARRRPHPWRGGTVIIPDVNLLVYAYNEAAPRHADARDWWETLLSRPSRVGLPWAVIFGFVRLVTHPRVLSDPLPPAAALDHVEAWLARAEVQVIEPGPRHLVIVRGLLEATGVAASLTTDTHLAALAIEHQSELHSNDADFARFPGCVGAIRWGHAEGK